MPSIKVKKGGVYTVPVGIFANKAGVWAKVAGVWAKVAGVYKPVSSAVAALFAQAGMASDYYPATVLPNQILLKKLRTDYPEFVVYSPMTKDGIEWNRWWFENRLNAGGAAPPGAGAPRMAKNTIAKLYASTNVPALAENLTTGTQAQAPTQAQATAAGARVGTWTAPATINGVTDVRYSTVVGDKVTYTVTAAQRIVMRSVFNVSNGGIVAVLIKDSLGAEIAADKYTVPLTGGERLVNLKNSFTGLGIIPLADDLPIDNYDVELSVAAANPGGGRAYDAGMYTNQVTAYNALGRTGTWGALTVGAQADVPTTFNPGAQVIYQFTGTKVTWRRGSSTNAGMADVRIFDSSGAPVDPSKYLIAGNEVDTWAGTTAIVETPLVAGLPLATYTAVIESKPSKNLSSTGWRIYDFGLIAYNEGAPGILGVDTFDDLGVDVAGYFGGNAMLIGFGNLEVAIANAASGNVPGAGDFSGGVHGHESAPTNLVMSIDGAPIDYAGAAIGQTWLGASFDFSCDSKLLGAVDNLEFADIHTVGRVSREGYLAPPPSITTTKVVRVREFYVLMFTVSDRSPGNIGAGGGFSFFAGLGDTVPTREFTSFVDGSNPLGAQVETGMFFNDQYAVVAQQIGMQQINEAFADPLYAGARPLSFVQTRTDKMIKWYNRAFSGSDSGVEMPIRSLGASTKLYRAIKRGAA